MKASLDSNIDISLDEILTIVSNLSEHISALLKDYSKIFRDSVGRFYYESMEALLNYLNDLIGSNDELKVYLNICDEMKVLLKHKLYNSNEHIIKNDK